MQNINRNLKNEAYYQGLKFKNSGLEEEVIYAKLEKQGIPMDLAKEVAKNVILERKKLDRDDLSDYKNYKKLGILIIALGLLSSIIAFVLTKRIVVAFEVLIVGISTTIIAHLMTKK